MAALVSNKRLGLLDLPPEIRNMIYLLLAPEPGTRFLGLESRWICVVITSEGYGSLIALLRTNRQIYGEAAYLAYGVATFSIKCSRKRLQWLRDLGDTKQHLRKVHIESIKTTYLCSFLHQLKEAGQLQSVTLGYWCYKTLQNREWSAENIAEALGPLAKALAKKRETQGAKRDAKAEIPEIFCIEKVSEVSSADLSWRYRQALVIDKGHENDFERAIREKLREILFLPQAKGERRDAVED